MSNILTTENIKKYNTKNLVTGTGEWVLRNGVWAMNIRPYPFYQNYTNDEGVKVSKLLTDDFLPNTQYYISLWIDSDDVHNDAATTYSTSGFKIWYSDETVETLSVVGGVNKGFQHKQIVTNSEKSISHIQVIYGRNLNTFYRGDSFIVPITKSNLNKTGVFNTGDFIETYEEFMNTKIGSGYVVLGRQAQFIEW